jgi:tripartite-type tricarboxylate transporter receptor subunit TctC
MDVCRTLIAFLAAIALWVGGAGDAATAQDAAPYFQGKQIRLVIGSAAGGGYDLFARTIAAHWPKHIPGNPTIVPQNLPGASSMQAANHIFTLAPRDGTVIGAVNPQVVTRAILDPGRARIDARDFTWIGSALRESQLMVARTDAPVKTFDEAFKTELIVGGSGGADETFPTLTNAVLGTRFKLVTGYPGTKAINLAMERGEVQANGGITWASVKGTMTAMLNAHKINLIVQYGLKPNHELPKVPLALSYAKTPAQRDALLLLFATQEFGRPYLAPPGTPAPVAAALRESFMATMQDPDFLADAHRRGLDIDPASGEEIDGLVRKLYATPADIVQRVAAIFGNRKKK